jgi:hypothetical protein
MTKEERLCLAIKGFFSVAIYWGFERFLFTELLTMLSKDELNKLFIDLNDEKINMSFAWWLENEKR